MNRQLMLFQKFEKQKEGAQKLKQNLPVFLLHLHQGASTQKERVAMVKKSVQTSILSCLNTPLPIFISYLLNFCPKESGNREPASSSTHLMMFVSWWAVVFIKQICDVIWKRKIGSWLSEFCPYGPHFLKNGFWLLLRTLLSCQHWPPSL